MTRTTAPLLLLMMLAACGDGQPFFADDEETTTPVEVEEEVEEVDPSDVLNTGTVRAPIAANFVARGDITRREASDEDGFSGLLASATYNAANDTFLVDGLGFDGANTYTRDAAIPQLGSYSVYEAELETPDALSGAPVNQIDPYQLVFGTSQNSLATGEPRTSFAIVRTGGYVQYGFGGYIYERTGDVVIPSAGQAVYSGDYVGVRVFDARGGLEFTRGTAEVAIDFADFNGNNAVRGSISDREAFAEDGTPIPVNGTDQLVLPQLRFIIRSGGTDIQANGELSGGLTSFTQGDGGALEVYEEGNYYAVIAGDATNAADGGEIVGIIVVESQDSRYEGVTAQETGGFIAYR